MSTIDRKFQILNGKKKCFNCVFVSLAYNEKHPYAVTHMQPLYLQKKTIKNKHVLLKNIFMYEKATPDHS